MRRWRGMLAGGLAILAAGAVAVDFARAAGDPSYRPRLLLDGEQLLKGLAPALAGAIAEANDRYRDEARPLPVTVRRALDGHFPPEVLATTRWVVGERGGATLIDWLNAAQVELLGVSNHAVTAGNVVIFARDPGEDLRLWAHELEHVMQYRRWGIDGFAARYVGGFQAIEAEAEAKARQVLRGGRSSPEGRGRAHPPPA